MYKAVIFDLDGTLLDTLQDLCNSVNYALKKHNLPERGIEEIRSFVGDGVKKLIERSASPYADEDGGILGDFRGYYSLHSKDNTVPYEGVMDLLNNLKVAGLKLAVVSNKIDWATKALCSEYFGSAIEVAIGDSEGRAKKPSPQPVMEALKQLGVNKDEAVYVGDSDVDVMTAQNCGMDCISVTWGFRTKDFLEKSGAKIFAENIKGLEELILNPEMN